MAQSHLRCPRAAGAQKDSFRLKKSAMEGIEEALFWHTVAVVADGGTGFGTAIAIRWNAHNLLVTANHVIEHTTDADLRFLFRPSGNLERAPWWEKGGTDKISRDPASPIRVLQRHQDATEDLAAQRVSPNLHQEVNLKFFDVQEVLKLPKRLPSLAAIGFPADSIEQLNSVAKAIQPFGLWSNPARPGRNPPDGYNRGRHILLDFAAALDGKHPGGFSGAGVWYSAGTPKSRIWHPNIRLAGICTHYYPRRRLVLVCRVKRIIAFLKRAEIG
jgi:hypothetical protein